MARKVPSNASIYTPDWWLLKLCKELDKRQTDISQNDAYYCGDHNLAFATPKFREAFGLTLNAFSDNWCALICDAVDERLDVQGFRYGDKQEGDDKAWAIWQANNLDALSQMGHLESFIKGESFVSVWYDPSNTSTPVITIEDATQCIVKFEQGSQTKRAAALKRWLDDDGFYYATVYLPDGLYKYQSASKSQTSGTLATTTQLTWVERDVLDEVWPLPNPLGVVPIVPLRNKPRLMTGGVSEIADIIPVQDATNKLITDMLVASEFGAAPQRWATGMTVPKDPTTGTPLPVFSKLVDRIWLSSNKDTNFGQFQPLNIDVFVKGIEMLVQHLASRSRTPPHYFYLSGQFPSGEAIKSAETGLVSKAKRRMKHFGEAWEEVMRLAFIIKRDKGRSQERAQETIWADAETRSESEHSDALIKRRALGVPLQQLWQDIGYSPQQIERFMAQLAEEAKLGLIPDPLAATATGTKVVKDFELAQMEEAGLGGGNPPPAPPPPSVVPPVAKPRVAKPAK